MARAVCLNLGLTAADDEVPRLSRPVGVGCSHAATHFGPLSQCDLWRIFTGVGSFGSMYGEMSFWTA